MIAQRTRVKTPPPAPTPVEPAKGLQRDLAEKIVKLLRQNPAFASDAEYLRIMDMIEDYRLLTLNIGASR